MTDSYRPAIIKKLFGEDFDGPLSHFDEWHALEYGAYAGLWAAMMTVDQTIATGLLAAMGVKSIKEMATGELKKQVKEERHYFITGAVVVFIVSLLLVMAFGVQPTFSNLTGIAETVFGAYSQ